ncbi:oxidoreductase [Pseudoruegeria sp. HB172150]|uniref:oxidoreductase n=1 Tax=Pseudoruegeria sp. HB172150 TaxID=2721164 RepID=UPI001556E71E|nr:oxidoreductase [Pseudoruegeria sp. HB172150]
MPSDASPAAILGQPLALPCGAVLKNRIAKSAMSDSLGDGRGNPTGAQSRLYRRWAEDGLALSIVGEVQPSPHYPEKPGNLVLAEDADAGAFRDLTRSATEPVADLWAQLGHAGALAHAPISHPKGPSALDVNGLTCEAMSAAEIRALPGLFATAAARAKSLGFTGVQIHAAHGFLLSQFLSPLFNRRTDAYGGSIPNRTAMIAEIVYAVRDAVGPAFPIAIKINSSDQLEGGLTETDALEVLRHLNATPLDIADISGGTYFPGAKPASDSAGGGPYFTDFAKRARAVWDKPLMVTGGFKTRQQAVGAIASGAADMIGLARALCLDTRLPNRWLSEGGDPDFPRFSATVAGGVTAWYTMRLAAMAEDRGEDFAMDLQEALESYEARDATRIRLWKERFGG